MIIARRLRNHEIGYMALAGLKGRFKFPKLQKGSPSYIERIVLDEFGEDYYSVRVITRTKKLSLCRAIIFYFLRRYTTMTLKEISNSFGVHHASVIHGIEKVNTLSQTDADIKEELNKLEMIIQNSF